MLKVLKQSLRVAQGAISNELCIHVLDLGFEVRYMNESHWVDQIDELGDLIKDHQSVCIVVDRSCLKRYPLSLPSMDEWSRPFAEEALQGQLNDPLEGYYIVFERLQRTAVAQYAAAWVCERQRLQPLLDALRLQKLTVGCIRFEGIGVVDVLQGEQRPLGFDLRRLYPGVVAVLSIIWILTAASLYWMHSVKAQNEAVLSRLEAEWLALSEVNTQLDRLRLELDTQSEQLDQWMHLRVARQQWVKALTEIQSALQLTEDVVLTRLYMHIDQPWLIEGYLFIQDDHHQPLGEHASMAAAHKMDTLIRALSQSVAGLGHCAVMGINACGDYGYAFKLQLNFQDGAFL